MIGRRPALACEPPDDFIPAQAVLELGGAARLRKGSASLSGIEAVDLQGSLRRLSFGGGEAMVVDGVELGREAAD